MHPHLKFWKKVIDRLVDRSLETCKFIFIPYIEKYTIPQEEYVLSITLIPFSLMYKLILDFGIYDKSVILNRVLLFEYMWNPNELPCPRKLIDVNDFSFYKGEGNEICKNFKSIECVEKVVEEIENIFNKIEKAYDEGYLTELFKTLYEFDRREFLSIDELREIIETYGLKIFQHKKFLGKIIQLILMFINC